MLRLRPALLLLPLACVLGYRGQASFSAEHDLAGIAEIRIELPDTPLTVTACTAGGDDCPDALTYDGRWVSLGGTPSDAEDNAIVPRLRFDRHEGFAALQAVVPLSRQGLVDLQMDEIRMPDDRDLDLRTGIGDVAVIGVAATVVIDVDIGDVLVRGADEGLGVHTGHGRVQATTPGHAEIDSDRGAVEVTQTGSARDLVVQAGRGDVIVHLASDSDLDLVVKASGRITVRTPAIAAVTSGALTRRTGTGAVRIEVVARSGDVEIDLHDGAD